MPEPGSATNARGLTTAASYRGRPRSASRIRSFEAANVPLSSTYALPSSSFRPATFVARGVPFVSGGIEIDHTPSSTVSGYAPMHLGGRRTGGRIVLLAANFWKEQG